GLPRTLQMYGRQALQECYLGSDVPLDGELSCWNRRDHVVEFSEEPLLVGRLDQSAIHQRDKRGDRRQSGGQAHLKAHMRRNDTTAAQLRELVIGTDCRVGITESVECEVTRAITLTQAKVETGTVHAGLLWALLEHGVVREYSALPADPAAPHAGFPVWH